MIELEKKIESLTKKLALMGFFDFGIESILFNEHKKCYDVFHTNGDIVHPIFSITEEAYEKLGDENE